MKRIGLPLILCVSFGQAGASEVKWSPEKNSYTISFPKPTHHEDNTVIEKDGIEGYRLVCSDPQSITELAETVNKEKNPRHYFYRKSTAPTFIATTPDNKPLQKEIVVRYVDKFVPVADTYETTPPASSGEPQDKPYTNIDFGIPLYTGIRYGDPVSCGVATLATNGLLSDLTVPQEVPLFKYEADSPPRVPTTNSYTDLVLNPIVMPLTPGKPIKRLSGALMWSQPLTTANGKMLEYNDIDYYKVFCGTSPDPSVLKQTLRTRAGRHRRVMPLVAKLRPDDKYCGVTALDKQGRESAMAVTQPFSAGACNLPPARPSLRFAQKIFVSN